LEKFGTFGQFWADFVAFAVVQSMPKLWLKPKKPHNFSTVSPNVTYNDSFKNYYPPLSTCLVSSAPEDYCIYNSLPKREKADSSSSGV
jgi:hypothetical protein